MSWDVYLEFAPCIHCGKSDETIDVRNVTYNNGRIFAALGVHPDVLQGRIAEDVEPLLRKALEEIPRRRDELVKLDPPNGWGGTDDAERFIGRFLNCCIQNPKGKVRIS